MMIAGIDNEKLFGLDVEQLLLVRKKLQVLGIDLVDIHDFLDRDAVQLQAQQAARVHALEKELDKIKITIAGVL